MTVRHLLLALLVATSLAGRTEAASAGAAVGRTAVRGVAGKGAVSGTLASQAAKASSAHALSAAERRAYAKVLREIDQGTLAKIEQQFGEHIPVGRLKEARVVPTAFLSHEQYQARLKSVYPQLTPAERRQVVGDLLGRPYADRNQVPLSRTLAHERLHQLRDPRFRGTLGRGLDEGTTEHLASRISGDLGIRDLPKGYPAERRIVEMLSARVGDRTLGRAYFRGEIEPLRRTVDGQLGKGALDSVAKLTAQGRFGEAEEILKHGLGRSRWWR